MYEHEQQPVLPSLALHERISPVTFANSTSAENGAEERDGSFHSRLVAHCPTSLCNGQFYFLDHPTWVRGLCDSPAHQMFGHFDEKKGLVSCETNASSERLSSFRSVNDIGKYFFQSANLFDPFTRDCSVCSGRHAALVRVTCAERAPLESRRKDKKEQGEAGQSARSI